MLQSPPGAPPSSAPAMDKSGPCGPGVPGSSAGGKAQPPRSASAGPAAGESKPKGGKSQDGTGGRRGLRAARGSVIRDGGLGPRAVRSARCLVWLWFSLLLGPVLQGFLFFFQGCVWF